MKKLVKILNMLATAILIITLSNSCNSSENKDENSSSSNSEDSITESVDIAPVSTDTEVSQTIDVEKFIGFWVCTDNKYISIKIWKEGDNIKVKASGYCYDNKTKIATFNKGRLNSGEGEEQITISYKTENDHLVEGSREFSQQ